MGVGIIDCETLTSHLQKILNEQSPEQGFIVENDGFALSERNETEEITAILEALPLQAGDIVIGYGELQ